MKSAAKSKKEETEYNYVNQYLENAPRMQKGAMAYDLILTRQHPKQRIESWQRQRQKKKNLL